MKKSFVFDKKTGTMVPANKVETPKPKEVEDVIKEAPAPQPAFEKEKAIETRVSQVEAGALKVKRVGTPSPIALVDKNGVMESYLDPIDSNVVLFRDIVDYDICQITDEKTNKVLAVIGGYALQIKFNLEELNTIEKIEQCLEGIKKLFRYKIVNQPLRETE